MALFSKLSDQSGFTALELITTLSISLILITTGIPAAHHLSTRSHMSDSINTVAFHLHLARSEAIKRNGSAVLCPSSDGQSCLDSFEWHHGLLLFMDENNDHQREVGENILSAYQIKTGPIEIFTTTKGRFIQYLPDGMARGRNATFTFCDSNEKMAPKKLTISLVGRVKLPGDGDPERCL